MGADSGIDRLGRIQEGDLRQLLGGAAPLLQLFPDLRPYPPDGLQAEVPGEAIL